MLFSEKNKLEIAENGHDSNGRTISVYVKTPGNNRIFIYNMYAPNLAYFEKDKIIDNNNKKMCSWGFEVLF